MSNYSVWKLCWVLIRSLNPSSETDEYKLCPMHSVGPSNLFGFLILMMGSCLVDDVLLIYPWFDDEFSDDSSESSSASSSIESYT